MKDDQKLERILFSTRFYFLYCIISFIFPLISAIVGYNTHEDSPDNSIYVIALGFYITYIIFGIWFKGCIYDIKDESHTQRTCTKIMMHFCLCGIIPDLGQMFLNKLENTASPPINF